MAWDIHGERLQPGHCEVHPWVHEEYPCSLCVIAHRDYKKMMAEYEAQCKAQADDHYAEQHAEWLLEGGVGLA